MQNSADSVNSIGQLLQVGANSVFLDCTFEENQAYYSPGSQGGKGIEIVSCDNKIIFQDCIFKDNVAKSVTPTLYMNRAVNVLFDGCSFSNLCQHPENALTKGSYM